MYKLLVLFLISIFFTSCAKDYTASKKVLPTLLNTANECKNEGNKDFEYDCYDLISYKNSVALIRLAVINYKKGNNIEALKQLQIAQAQENFYANSIISDILKVSAKTPEENKKVITLLEDTKHVDPIAAYKLYFYYKAKDKNKEAFKLLEFAAKNGVNEALYELSKLYANDKDNKLVQNDLALSLFWLKEAQNSKKDLVYEIYGVKNYFK